MIASTAVREVFEETGVQTGRYTIGTIDDKILSSGNKKKTIKK